MNPVALYNNNPFTFGQADAPAEQRFDPYADNGGTSAAIAGEDFCVVASDTRQSSYMSINTRYAPKVYKLTEKAVFGTSGFYADGRALVKRLGLNLEWYKHAHDKEMSISALAQMTANTLYYKRFFPYYSFNLLGGLDSQGKGVVYSFDPVGSYEGLPYSVVGSANSLIEPFLDNQVGFKNQQGVQRTLLPLDTVIRIIKDAFASAAERETQTGDYLEMFIIRNEGITVERFDLKKD